MAEKRVQLAVDAALHDRLLRRAASDDATVQNVVVAACRAYIDEHQRGRVGHRGRRAETQRGGPVGSHGTVGPATLDLKIGRDTYTELEARARRAEVTTHTVILRATRAWLGDGDVPGGDDDGRAVGVAGLSAASAADEERPPASSHVPVQDAAGMSPDDLQAFVNSARRHLAPIFERSGNVLYSGVETLRPGTVYLLGLNPGGDPDDEILRAQTIGKTLAALPTKHENEWLDKSWRRTGVRTPPGKSPLQLRVQALLRELGLEPREACSANLIFARSRNAAGSGFRDLAPLCWPVHEQILGIVRPRVILTIGNASGSPYAWLKSRLAPTSSEVTVPSGHGGWTCRSFTDGRYRVVGLPHLSRYAVDRHPHVFEWLRRLAVEA